MSNRDALRKFQNRLAERLQAARTTGVSASWLAVEAGGCKYLFPLGHSGEIFPWSLPQPVPYTAAWFLGVANLRGGLYGVVDLSRFISGPQAPAMSEAGRMQSRLVAFNELLEVNCALQVERLLGLRSVDSFASSHAPASDAVGWMGHTYIDEAGEVWQEINLQALALQPEFLNIGA